MLRRRIFSAAMASVMALSSVAVVAQAAETTNQVKTKADLEELITKTYGDSWRADDLSDYGADSQAAMLDALEAADVILADADADEEDYTVAYMMVEAVANKLVIHTVDELKALLAECEPIIATNNIFNEELQDQIYTAESFGNLETEYTDAEKFVTSTSSTEITAAYEALYKAKDKLVENAKVTKSMFRNILKEYDEILDDQFAYDTWRRGSIGWADTSMGNYWKLQGLSDNTGAAFGYFYNMALEAKDDIKDAYSAIDSIKGLTKTTDAEIYAGYILAKDIVAVYASWQADNVGTATKSGLSALVNKYHGQLVHDYATTDASDLLSAITTAAGIGNVVISDGTAATDANLWYTESATVGGITKLYKAQAVIKVTNKSIKAVYVPVDDNGYWDGNAVVTTKPTAGKYQTISVNSKFDISKLIDITGKVTAGGDVAAADNMTLDASGEYAQVMNGLAALSFDDTFEVSLSKAMDIAEDYLTGDKKVIAASDVKDIDETGVIADGVDPAGTSKEYQVVYRYLYYALTEKYDGSLAAETTYTRADVKALIEDAWELIEDTGDASIFRTSNVNLVEARRAAMAWVAQANSDKLYKENTAGKDANGEIYITSTQAYKDLKALYDALQKEYDALKYSFGEIYDKLAGVAEDIDDGKLDATDDLLAAMDDVAYALSCIDPVVYYPYGGEYDDNAAFDIDRVFMPNNRLITASGDLWQAVQIAELNNNGVTNKNNPTHAALATAYDALLKAIAAQAEAEVVLGDANGDGKVNTADAAAIAKYAVGLGTVDEKAADYNKDGKVNVADAAAIIKAIVGLN